MNILNTTLTAKRLLLGGVAVLGVAALAGCGGGGSSLAPAAPAESTKTDGTETETGTPVVSFKVASTDSVAADAGTQNITVDLSEPAPEGGLTLSYTVGDGTTSTAGTVRVVAGDRTVTIPVPVPAGSGGKTFTVTLVKGANYIPEDRNATFTLMVGEKMAPDPVRPVVSLDRSSVRLDEGGGDGPKSAEITVTLSESAPDGGLTLGYAITGDAEDNDIQLAFNPSTVVDNADDTITVPAGTGSFVITVTATDDSTAEGGGSGLETFTVTFNDPDDDSYTVDQTYNTLELMVYDMGSFPTTPRVQFSTATASVDESAGTYEITVELDSERTTDVVLSYTVSGTATSGSDYTAPSGTVTIPAGQTSAVIRVPITDDTANEIAETIIVTISSSDDYDIGTGTFTLTINSDPGDVPATPVNPQVSVGTGTNHVSGESRDISRVLAALGRPESVQGAGDGTAGNVNRGLSFIPEAPEGVTFTHWGTWLESDNRLRIWAQPPAGTTGRLFVDNADFTGASATYEGDVTGLAYHGTHGREEGGQFTADISLTANFTDDTFSGEVTGFDLVAPDATDPTWSVTLEDGGFVSGDATDGNWTYGFYRGGDSGNPDGAVGDMYLEFSDGRAAGAFLAVGE